MINTCKDSFADVSVDFPSLLGAPIFENISKLLLILKVEFREVPKDNYCPFNLSCHFKNGTPIVTSSASKRHYCLIRIICGTKLTNILMALSTARRTVIVPKESVNYKRLDSNCCKSETKGLNKYLPKTNHKYQYFTTYKLMMS